MSETGKVIPLNWGFIRYGNDSIGVFDNREAPNGDPAEFRLGSRDGLSLGKISINRLRADGGEEEVILIQGKIDERVRNTNKLHGELTVHIRGEGQNDASMKHIVTLRHDGVEFHVPTNVNTTPQPPVMLQSDDKRFRAIMQNDGNFVVYEYEPHSDEWLPLFDTNSRR